MVSPRKQSLSWDVSKRLATPFLITIFNAELRTLLTKPRRNCEVFNRDKKNSHGRGGEKT